jgi:hypothetical protein
LRTRDPQLGLALTPANPPILDSFDHPYIQSVRAHAIAAFLP